MNKPVVVAVSGAAGQIGYSLVFRIASGAMLGPDQPVVLQLLEVPQALGALEGVRMELADCAFPLLAGVVTSDDPIVAFAGADVAILVGGSPRKAGMERADLLSANAAIYKAHGAALGAVAAPGVKVLVVGNPANSNAQVAATYANLPAGSVTAMTRLDHNRAVSALASHLQVRVDSIVRVGVWGNHSTSQYPDLSHAYVGSEQALSLVTPEFVAETFIPTVAQRGAAVIAARGSSSAASAANAAIDHVRDWVCGSQGRWVSMGVVSTGEYGVPAGLVCSFPCICENGTYKVVADLTIDEFSRAHIDASVAELVAERDTLAGLGVL